jgi:hypothetical protein
MHEVRFWIPLSGFDGIVHVAKRSGENNITFFLLNQAVNDSGRVCLADRFDIYGLEPRQFFLYINSAGIMRVCPAEIPHVSDIYEAGFQLFILGNRTAGDKKKTKTNHQYPFKMFHCFPPPEFCLVI